VDRDGGVGSWRPTGAEGTASTDRRKHLARQRSAADHDDLRFLDQRGDGCGRLLGTGASGLTEQGSRYPNGGRDPRPAITPADSDPASAPMLNTPRKGPPQAPF
jgi:hypothetical protein